MELAEEQALLRVIDDTTLCLRQRMTGTNGGTRSRYYSSTILTARTRLGPKTLCPTVLHCFQTIVGTDLAQHTPEVVLDGLLRQV